RGEEILALRRERRAPSSLRRRAAAATDRGDPHRRYELVEFMGRVRSAVPQHPRGLSRSRAGKERAQRLDARRRQGGDRARRPSETLEIRRRELRSSGYGGPSCIDPVKLTLLSPRHWPRRKRISSTQKNL